MTYLTGNTFLLLIAALFFIGAMLYLKRGDFWSCVYGLCACLINVAVVMKGMK